MNNKPGPTIGLFQQQGMGMQNRLEQRLKLAPPIAETESEVMANAVKAASAPKLNAEVLYSVVAYVMLEGKKTPFTDVQIGTQISEDLGYSVTRQDVAQARRELGILPSLDRKY